VYSAQDRLLVSIMKRLNIMNFTPHGRVAKDHVTFRCKWGRYIGRKEERT
jgi:hypothetical protein